MALDTLSSLMILVCAVALVILVSLTVYTWYKWHMKEVQQAATPYQAASAELAVEMTSYTPHHPQSHFQRGYLNAAGRDSPNLSGSRTFLGDEVLKQKPNPPPSAFESKDVVFHANMEHNPDELKSSDIVFHGNGPFAHNKTTHESQTSQVVYNVDGTSGKRRWTESMAPGEDVDEKDVSHRQNTYL